MTTCTLSKPGRHRGTDAQRNSVGIQTHKHIADLFRKQGRAAHAIAHYRKALEIRPNDAEARLNLARALAEQNQ